MRLCNGSCCENRFRADVRAKSPHTCSLHTINVHSLRLCSNRYERSGASGWFPRHLLIPPLTVVVSWNLLPRTYGQSLTVLYKNKRSEPEHIVHSGSLWYIRICTCSLRHPGSAARSLCWRHKSQRWQHFRWSAHLCEQSNKA